MKKEENQRLAVIEKAQALDALVNKLSSNFNELVLVAPLKAYELESVYETSVGVLSELFIEGEYGIEEFLDRSIRVTKKINKKTKKAIKKYSK